MSIGNPIGNPIGSRFWQFSSTGEYAQVRDKLLDDAQPLMPDRKIHNSGLTSFLKNGKLDVSNETVRSAVNRAEIFAATHVLTAGQRADEAALARTNAQRLGIDVDSFCTDVLGVAIQLTSASSQPSSIDIEKFSAFIETALRKLLVSREAESFAEKGQLSEQGVLSLQNAVLGLAGMLERGEISENAVLLLADGGFYDISKTADVLKLAATTAAKVKETFIGEESLRASLRYFQEKLEEAEKAGNIKLVTAMAPDLLELSQAMNTLLELRRRAAGGILTEYELTDADGKDASDKKFQTEQIKHIRESLRAFRYDLDICAKKPMGLMERFRRWCDDITPRFKLRTRQATTPFGHHPFVPTLEKNFRVSEENRITDDLYRQLLIADEKYNEALEGLRKYFPGDKDAVANTDTRMLADEATALSHTANDAIRYYFSGREKKEISFAEKVHKELDIVAQRGGSRQVSIEVGAEFMVKVGLGELIEGKAGGGGSYKFKVQLSVPDGGGPISVTYRHSGKLYGGIKGKAGGETAHVQADIGAEAHAGLSGEVKRTYANLDDFIDDVNGSSMVMSGSFTQVVFGGAKKLAKGAVSLVLLGATKLGFRIHKSRMDKVAYAAALRKSDVFSNLDGLLLRRKNSTAIKSRKAYEVSGGASANAQAKTFGILGAGMSSKTTNLAFGGSAGLEVGREFGVQGKCYRSFAKSLAKCSLERLEKIFDEEAETLAPEEGKSDAVDNLERLLNDALDRDGVADGIEKLMLFYEDLESTAAGRKKDDTEFWRGFAQEVRLCSIAAEILVRRGEQIGERDSDEALLGSVKAVKTWFSGRMANPAVRIPPAIFEEVLQKVSPVATPPVLKIQGDIEVSAQLGDNWISQKVDSVKGLQHGADDIVIDPDSFHASVVKTAAVYMGKSIGKSTLTSAAQVGRRQLGLAPKVHAKFAYSRPVGKKTDVRPWAAATQFSVDVEISSSMPVRVLVEVLARAYVQGYQDKKDMDKSLLYDEIKSEILASIGYDVVLPAALKGAGGVLALGVGELAVYSSSFRKFLVDAGVLALKVAKPVLSANPVLTFDSKTEFSKTVSFGFVNGRMCSFAASDSVTKSTSIGLGISGFGFSFNYSVGKSVTDYSILTKPSVVSMLGEVNTQLETGNPEMLKGLLVANKNGVFRLMRAASLDAADAQIEGDKSFADDRVEMARILKEVDGILYPLHSEASVNGDEARDLWERFESVRKKVQYPVSGQTEAQRLETAREFFTVLASAYGLQARIDAEKETRETAGIQASSRPNRISGRFVLSEVKAGERGAFPPKVSSVPTTRKTAPAMPVPHPGGSSSASSAEMDIPLPPPLPPRVNYTHPIHRQTGGGNTCFLMSLVNGLERTDRGQRLLASLNSGGGYRFNIVAGSDLRPVNWPPVHGSLSDFERQFVDEYVKHDAAYRQRVESEVRMPYGSGDIAARMLGLVLAADVHQITRPSNPNTVKAHIQAVLARGGVVTANVPNSHFTAITEINGDWALVVDSSSGVASYRRLADLCRSQNFEFYDVPDFSHVTLDSVRSLLSREVVDDAIRRSLAAHSNGVRPSGEAVDTALSGDARDRFFRYLTEDANGRADLFTICHPDAGVVDAERLAFMFIHFLWRLQAPAGV